MNYMYASSSSIKLFHHHNPPSTEWSGDAIVRRYLQKHGRMGVYEQMRRLVQEAPADGAGDNHTDEAMMSFGA